MKIYRKYIGKINWLASNTRPDISVYVINSTRSEKTAMLKDLRDIIGISAKVEKKEKRAGFKNWPERMIYVL